MDYYVYILASKYNGTLYVGVTSDLVKRVYQHKHKYVSGFSEKYDITRLIYFERHKDINSARLGEKRIKRWNRVWKIRLIEEVNPEWKDLYKDII